MLLPKGGLNWKAAKAQLPPSRAIWNIVSRKRFLGLVVFVGSIMLLWRGITSSASEMRKYVHPSPLTSRAGSCRMSENSSTNETS